MSWVLERFDIAGVAAETADDFAEAIDALLADEALRHVTAQRALTALRDHAPEVAIGRMETVLRETARAARDVPSRRHRLQG